MDNKGKSLLCSPTPPEPLSAISSWITSSSLSSCCLSSTFWSELSLSNAFDWIDFPGRESMCWSPRLLVDCWLTMDLRWSLWNHTHIHSQAQTQAPLEFCNYTFENESGPGGDSGENAQSNEWWLMHERVCMHTVFSTDPISRHHPSAAVTTALLVPLKVP